MTDTLITSGRQFVTRHLGADTCSIRRDVGKVLDPLTGSNETLWVAIYSGIPCHVRPLSTRDVVTGGEPVAAPTHRVIVPWTLDGIIAGDTLVVTESDDPDLIGAAFIVEGVDAATFAIRRTLTCRLTPNRIIDDSDGSS